MPIRVARHSNRRGIRSCSARTASPCHRADRQCRWTMAWRRPCREMPDSRSSRAVRRGRGNRRSSSSSNSAEYPPSLRRLKLTEPGSTRPSNALPLPFRTRKFAPLSLASNRGPSWVMTAVYVRVLASPGNCALSGKSRHPSAIVSVSVYVPAYDDRPATCADPENPGGHRRRRWWTSSPGCTRLLVTWTSTGPATP